MNDASSTTQPSKKRLRRPRAPEWLRKPEIAEDGSMALADHLREIRYRVIVSAFWIVLFAALSLIFNKQLLALATWPVARAVEMYNNGNPNAMIQMTTSGVMGSFAMWMRVGGFAGLLLSCPIWLYQIWAFIVPGLLENEKKAAVRFLGASIPLFLSGVALGYWVMPNGFAMMFTFNPQGVVNIVDVEQYLVLELRLLLAFGISFLLPVVLIELNRFGLVTGEGLSKARNFAILGCAVFAAVITPSGDPISMLAICGPMTIMYIFSEQVAKRHDRKVLENQDDDVPVVIGEPTIQ